MNTYINFLCPVKSEQITHQEEFSTVSCHPLAVNAYILQQHFYQVIHAVTMLIGQLDDWCLKLYVYSQRCTILWVINIGYGCGLQGDLSDIDSPSWTVSHLFLGCKVKCSTLGFLASPIIQLLRLFFQCPLTLGNDRFVQMKKTLKRQVDTLSNLSVRWLSSDEDCLLSRLCLFSMSSFLCFSCI